MGQGGYQDWVRHQEALAWTRRLVEASRELATDAGEIPLAEHLSGPLAVVLGRLRADAGRAPNGLRPERRLQAAAADAASVPGD